MPDSSGCPFNNFGPCLHERCKFYLPFPYSEHCVIIENSIVSHISMMHTETIMEMINLIGYALGFQKDFPIADDEYAVLNRLSHVLSHLELSSSFSPVARERLSESRKALEKILSALFPDYDDNEK